MSFTGSTFRLKFSGSCFIAIEKNHSLKAPSIFICHSHRDKRFAQRLSHDLDALSVSVWIDAWRLSVGDSLHGCIGKAIEESAYVGVLLSPSTIESRWCQDELEQALSREKRSGQKVVLPLLYRRVIPPPFLEGRLHLNFSSSYWKSLTLLVSFLYKLDQQLVFEASSHTCPHNLEDVRAILHRCGLSSEIPRPLDDYRHLERIFKNAGVDIPRDRLRLILSELKDGLSISLVDVPGLGAESRDHMGKDTLLKTLLSHQAEMSK